MDTKTKIWAERAGEILRARLEKNTAAGIWASESHVIEHLLDDATEMRKTWEAVGQRLQDDRQFSLVLEVIINAAFYAPAKANKHRDALRWAAKLNEEIAQTARQLADLLDRQTKLKNSAALRLSVSNQLLEHLEQWPGRVCSSKHDYDTNRRACLFKHDVAPGLKKLSRQYDLKYWPTVSDLLHGIADAADDGYAESYDPIILACTRSRESSNLDFLRAFLEDLQRAKEYDNLVSTFKCSDNELTAITNCALGLVEDAYSLGAIKKARQRIENEMGTTR